MGISCRHYLFPQDGSLKRIPQRIADALPFGRDAIPEYAGTTQRVAQVIVELEDARPVRILDARGFVWEFDEDGRVDEDMHRRLADRMDLLGAVPPKRGGRGAHRTRKERSRARTRSEHLGPLTSRRKAGSRHIHQELAAE